MMKILVTADWHFDLWLRADTNPYGKIAPELEGIDALIIAGDLANNPGHGWPNLFGYLKYLIDLDRVWVIPGNHDYHGWLLDDDDGLAEIVANAGVNFAQKRVIEIGGSRFLCCTLWTDFALTGDISGAMMAARLTLPDYGRITFGPEHRSLEPADLLKLHVDHLAWLEDQPQEPFDGRTFVVTHHGPHREVAGRLDRASPAYASNLDSFILHHQPDGWLFGHTHRWLEARIGVTLIRNVSLGYPHEVDPQHERTLLLRGLIDDGALGTI